MSWGPEGFGLPIPLTQVSQGDYDIFLATSCANCSTDQRPLTDIDNNPAGTVKDFITPDGQVIAKVLYHVEGRDDEYFIATFMA